MLQDCYRRPAEIHDQISRRFDIENIGVAELLPLQLAKMIAEGTIQASLLVRIVTVAQLSLEWYCS